MKGKIWRYFGLCSVVLLCLLLNTFFTENTNAATLDLSGFEIVNSYPTLMFQACEQQCDTASNWTANAWDISIKTNVIGGLRTAGSFDFKKGDFVEIDLELRSEWEPTIALEYFIIRMGLLGNNDFDIVGYEEIWDSSYVQKQYEPDRNLSPSTYYEYGKGYLYKIVKLTYVAKRDGKYQFKIGARDSNAAGAIVITSNFMNTPITEYGIRTRLNNMIIYRNLGLEQLRQEQEDRDNIESQSEQTNSDANSSEQQLSGGTSSLMGVISSFSNAMVSIRRTNCKVSGINAYGFDLGELDLCTFSPPNWIQGLTSALVSLIVIRLAYKVFKRIMGLVKGMAQ